MRILICCLFFMGCARSEIKTATEAMRLSQNPPPIVDQHDSRSLVKALIENIEQLRQNPSRPMTFGEYTITQTEYAQALEKFLLAFKEFKTKEDINKYIDKNFKVLETYGNKDWGEVFITSYYEPVIKGSAERSERFSQALYSTPKDMVLIDVGEFADVFPKWQLFVDEVLEQKSRRPIVRGRIEKPKQGLPKIHPYYSRQQIDEEKLIKDSSNIIAWVDPIDAFFLQIQGSGVVELSDGGRMHIGYDSQNGHPYVPIGKFLYDYIPKEEMSLQSIERHMRSLPANEQQQLMNQNPSYVFFKNVKKRGITYFGSGVVEGRTVATDYNLFPKGSLAFLKFPMPIVDEDNKIIGQVPHSRLVVDQDTGGAIRGPHRLDLFWGRGDEAKKYAGVMKHWGQLYYLYPKNIEEFHGQKSSHGSQANTQSTHR